MEMKKEECANAILVLQETLIALKDKDSLKLRELSDRTIHSSCFYQNEGSITSAVLIYTLSKLVERQDYNKIKYWENFVKKFSSYIELAISALKKSNMSGYEKELVRARESLAGTSVNLKAYIQEVLRKASINKGAKLYEHGLSLGKTSELLGITKWELAEYTSQKQTPEINYQTINIKTRAKMALEFFS